MRILFVSNYYPPYEVGGYEQLCSDVANRLRERGHQIAVLTSDQRAHGRDDGREEADVRRVLRIGPSRRFQAATGIEFFTIRTAKTRHNIGRVQESLSTLQPDVVFIWNLQGLPIEIARVCEERQEVAVAYWLAGYSPAEPDGYWRYWEREPANRALALVKKPLRRLALRMMVAEGKPVHPQMRYVAVVSRYMRDTGIAAGMLPESAKVIYNGVEFERFCRPVRARDGQPLRLLQAGRVSCDKGVHTVIEALAHLAEQGTADEVDLVIAGSGPAAYERELRQLVAGNRLRDKVKFLGWVARDRMPDVMASRDVLLLPTEHPEPFARVMLEGMAAGLAVIGSRTGGTDELLQDGENGLIFEAGDSLGLANQIARLLEDDELRQRVAVAGQREVKESYTLDVMVAKIERLLEESVAEMKWVASDKTGG